MGMAMGTDMGTVELSWRNKEGKGMGMRGRGEVVGMNKVLCGWLEVMLGCHSALIRLHVFLLLCTSCHAVIFVALIPP